MLIIPSESEIRAIVEKHLRSITLPIKPAPGVDLRQALTEAIRQASPYKPPRESDVSAIVKQLAAHSTVDRRNIQETASGVVQASDAEELNDLVLRLLNKLKQANRTITRRDVAAVIRTGNLAAAHSSVSDIRRAVERYLAQPRAVRDIPEEEVRAWIRSLLRRYGPVDERETTHYLNQYFANADKSKPFDPKDVTALIATQKPQVLAGVPQVTQAVPQVAPGRPVPPKNLARPTFFDRIRERMYREGIQPLTQQARNWLKDNIRKAASPSQAEIFRRSKVANTITNAFIGQMFFYSYDAKWKDELPYWDAFPLTVITSLSNTGWMGINLHYLPIDLRIFLLGTLLGYADNTSLDNVKRLQISADFLKAFSQSSVALPCVKQYLADHVASYLLPVQPVDYEIAVFLPVEQFQKATKQRVWQDSRRMSRG